MATAVPVSDFNYLAPGELSRYIHKMSSVTNSGLAAKFISDAERLVDELVGPAPKFYPHVSGKTQALVASGTSTTATVGGGIFGRRRADYWARGGIYFRVLDAPGASALNGQERLIVGSTKDTESVTLASGFSIDVPAGTEFDVRQVSVFPRAWDQDPFASPQLPFLLAQVVAAQVEYGIFFGSEEFGLGDDDVVTDERGDVQSRSYGSGYSESRDPRRRQGLSVWVGPKARALARRLLNSTGRLRS